MKKVILLLLFFTTYFASFSQTKTTNQVVIGSVKLDFGTPITETSISGFKLYNISTGGGTFGIGSSGTFPNWVTTGSLNTLNIPYANTAGVTGGILSNTDYLAFKNNRWSTTGNAGTVQATNFVGTTDNIGLSLRTNNIIRQTIDNTGKIGIGNTLPTSTFDLTGSFSLVPTITGNPSFTLTDAHNIIYLTSGVAQTANLPTASTVTGRIYTVINPTSGSKFFGTAVTTIEGPPLITLPPYKSITIQSDGTTWRVISENSVDATTALSGRVSTTAQTFAGNKTFNGNTTIGDAGTDIHNINGTVNFNSNVVNFNNAISQTPLALTNFTVGGAITTATTLSQYSYVTLTQTTPNISLILPIMGAGDVNKLLYVENKGSVAVILDIINYILPNKGMLFRWGGTSWISYNDNNRTPLTATATATIPLGYQNVVCQNGATPITLTLPDPSICVGHKMYFTKAPGSTGLVTLTNAGTPRIQALAGTVGATTTLAAFGANETWNIGLIATNTSLGYAWLRIN